MRYLKNAKERNKHLSLWYVHHQLYFTKRASLHMNLSRWIKQGRWWKAASKPAGEKGDKAAWGNPPKKILCSAIHPQWNRHLSLKTFKFSDSKKVFKSRESALRTEKFSKSLMEWASVWGNITVGLCQLQGNGESRERSSRESLRSLFGIITRARR